MNISRQWDAVVIGAGPAGAVAAGLLARRGYSVLLVDRKPLGRRKVCGCCWSTSGLELLAAIGARERLGGVPLRAYRLVGPGIDLLAPIPAGLAVSRESADTALVQFAVDAGAHFLPNVRARVGEAVEDGRQVHFDDSEGGIVVHGRVVLAADGLGHPSLCHLPAFQSFVAPSSYLGAGCAVGDYPQSIERGVIHMALGRQGYVGMVVLESGELNVAAALRPSLVQRHEGLASAAGEIFIEAGMPPIESLLAARWTGTPCLTRRESSLAAARLFLLGDAGGYAEPFTGEGMTWAVMSACAVQPMACRAIEDWQPKLTWEWTARWRRMLGSRHLACRALAGLLRMPLAVSGVTRWMSRSPALTAKMVRMISGGRGAEALQQEYRHELQAAGHRHGSAAASD